VADVTLWLAVVLAAALSCYALLAGADYGGGVWDLLARGATAERQRETIARAIGPVWEANHVWLIIAVVILFAGFPRAFSTVSTALHIPLVLALVGVVLRGSAFVFRAYGSENRRHQRLWGRVFAIASTVTPLLLGTIVGAITEGRLRSDTNGSFIEVFVSPWLTPFAAAVGLFALVLFAFLAAVYLTVESDEHDVQEAFRMRAIASGIAVFVLALAVLLLGGPEVHDALLASSWAQPLHGATAIAAIAAFLALWKRAYRAARIAAAAQVTLILWGWALVQFPYAVRPSLTLADAAAPADVQAMLLAVLAAGAVILLPSLLFLFRLFGPRGENRARHP
jgi:cytochrome d ubiquinol oxidase subunit II